MKYILLYITILYFLISCNIAKNQCAYNNNNTTTTKTTIPSVLINNSKWALKNTEKIKFNNNNVYLLLDEKTSLFEVFTSCNKIEGYYLLKYNNIDFFDIKISEQKCKEMKIERILIYLLKITNKIKINTSKNLDLYRNSILLMSFKKI